MPDFVIELGDHVVGTDNNYIQDDSAMGKVSRCIRSAYGKWPGGRGETVGNAYWNRPRQKGSESNRQQLLNDFEDALTPLEELGVISDIEVAFVPSNRADSPRIRVKFRDVATQKVQNLYEQIPWGT